TVHFVLVGALDDGDHHRVALGAGRDLDAADGLGIAVARGVARDDGDRLGAPRDEHAGRRAGPVVQLRDGRLDELPLRRAHAGGARGTGGTDAPARSATSVIVGFLAFGLALPTAFLVLT